MIKNLPTTFIAIILFTFITACNLGAPPTLQSQTEVTDSTLAMVTFKVKLPAPLPPGESIYLVEVDEITGLAFNQIRHIMEAEDSQNFLVVLPLPLNTVFKYRYLRQGEYGQTEYSLGGNPVRYRIYYAKEPGSVKDIIGQWIDRKDPQPTGRITGKAIDSSTGNPLPDIMIAVGGMTAWTSSEGIFQIQDLPVGIHNLVAYAPDGGYSIFQQEAAIAVDAATEANLLLEKNQSIKVTFTVEPPRNTPPGSTMRIVGNLWQLGNSYADLRGGVGHSASRLPALSLTSNGAYQITLNLPAGFEIRYKYTLGDGIWNAEHDINGEFVSRKVLLPNQNIEIIDRVISWKDSSRESIRFTVEAPQTTPPDESVSIQFNPGYTWLEPIPMLSDGGNRWQFTLFSPLKGLEEIQYRYCRDVQCSSADDASTPGNLALGRTLDLTAPLFSIEDKVVDWLWYQGKPASAVVPNLTIQPRTGNFVAGVELQEGYHPYWYHRFPATVNDLLEINANWILLRPSWSYIDNDPPLQQPISGQDMPGSELKGMLNYARSHFLQTAIFPISNYPKQPEFWWAESTRDFPWWISWFDRYHEFINHFALIANQTGASALILGDPSISPALPGSSLVDQTPSNTPEDASDRWGVIIEEARKRFSGQIWWAIDSDADWQNSQFPFDQIDGFYILFDEPLAAEPGASLEVLVAETGRLLDDQILPLQQTYAKPVILVVAYPSASGGTTGCLPGIETPCLDLKFLNRPNPDIPNITLDLHEQENAYNAILLAVNERPWISGIVSSGFYPPVPLQDKSTSVHGKPSSGVLWFWYGRFLGK
jgi:hypothetical protein